MFSLCISLKILPGQSFANLISRTIKMTAYRLGPKEVKRHTIYFHGEISLL